MSDIKIYGEHEPKTLVQMQRCMTVGSAVKGVLCADGHLGYAHPIGGVVAYEEDISISGVGFDIACGNMGQSSWMRVTPTSCRAPRPFSMISAARSALASGSATR
jgi:tRNA-splicing ligase RtcB (3'-phosphate/5'-hydroxy nucleic acid ligase)